MLARIAATLTLLVLITIAVLVSRVPSLQGIALTEDARIAEGSLIPQGAPIAIGDRIIRADGYEVHRAGDIDRVLLRSGASIELRVVSSGNEQRRTLSVANLRDEIDPVLTPEFYITSIDGVPMYGALLPDVARALSQRGVDEITVSAVPVGDVFDGSVDVARGVPPTPVLAGTLAAICGLILVVMLSAGVGSVVGLSGVAFALWSTEGIVWARILALVLVAIAGVLAAWLLIEPVSVLLTQRGRARSHEGKESRPDLLDALTHTEEEFGFPVYVAVGSAQLAIQIGRDYERLAVTDADAILTASLQMLLTEGGVFPRADVGDGVAESWDDPLHDLDISAGIACAVPIPRYGTSSDQWAFVIALVQDVPKSMALLEPMIALADQWAKNGVREAIAVHASHSLFRMIREARNTTSVIPHQPVRAAVPVVPSTAEEKAGLPMLERPQASLDRVSEGVGIPRRVTREELERRKQAQASSPSTSAAEPFRRVSASVSEPSSPLQRVARPPAPTMSAAAKEELESLRAQNAALRAWAGHLERELQDAYPVDDPEAFGEADWYEIQHLKRDERPCLIIGESGVGKEFVARALHWHGQRAHKRIAVMDFGRLPESVAELELFGDAGDGALVDLLEGGALVLKSPSAMGRGAMDAMFRRLLARDIRLYIVERYVGLESGVPRQIGPSIRELVGDRFVHLRPLRERPEDIVRYARYFLEQEALAYGEKVLGFEPAAERLLESMELPCNLTELRVVVRSAIFRMDDELVDARALIGESADALPRELARAEADEERLRLVAALQETEGNKSEAARVLGLSRGALLRRLKRHGLM